MTTTATKTDISYKKDGLFTTFFADSQQGGTAVSDLMTQNGGSNKVLTIHADAVITQLRAAGYTVRKARPVSAKEVDSILAELGDLLPG
ncbi:hypothetical protein [Paraburkholderia sp. GAS32]|uniref:hypothetical protein n=1 Tax=Paraburkholderia sp. GAS32 TaxID=3035129 RepID=UPI003D1E5F14